MRAPQTKLNAAGAAHFAVLGSTCGQRAKSLPGTGEGSTGQAKRGKH